MTMMSSPASAVTAPSQAILEVAARLQEKTRPQVLDLGVLSDRTIQFFLSRGCRVFVEAAEDLRLARTAPAPDDGAAPPPIRLDYPDASFDGVLLWDVFDYLPDAVARAFALEVTRVSRRDSFLLLYADTRRNPPAEPLQRWRLTEEGGVEHFQAGGAPQRRVYRENRDMVRLFPRHDVRRSTLLRSQAREMLLHRVD